MGRIPPTATKRHWVDQPCHFTQNDTTHPGHLPRFMHFPPLIEKNPPSFSFSIEKATLLGNEVPIHFPQRTIPQTTTRNNVENTFFLLSAHAGQIPHPTIKSSTFPSYDAYCLKTEFLIFFRGKSIPMEQCPSFFKLTLRHTLPLSMASQGRPVSQRTVNSNWHKKPLTCFFRCDFCLFTYRI